MSLTNYYALLVSDKPTLEGLMNIYLKKAGISDFTTAYSLREAVTKATQEIPHVIIVYENTADASAIQIVEAIRKQPALNRALIFIIGALEQSEIVRSIQLKVSAVIKQTNEPNIFIEKIKQKLENLGGFSPYAITGGVLPGGDKASLKIPLKIMGKLDNHVVCISPIIAPAGTTVSVHPDDRNLESFMVTFAASNAEANPDGNFQNFFSISGIIGKGRGWLQQKLASIEKTPTTSKKRLLVFERQSARIDPLKKVLKFHGIECEHVDSVANLCNTYKTGMESFSAVYFSEPLIGSISISWDKTKKEIPSNKQCVEIIATSAMEPLPKPQVIWLQKPFGIEQIVESFQAANVSDASSTGAVSTSIKSVPCSCITPVKILALDESGGLFLSEILPATNTEIFLNHNFIKENPVFGNVRVVSVKPLESDPSMSVVRFVFGASSKEKYWASVCNMFETIRNPAPAKVAAPATTQASPAPVKA